MTILLDAALAYAAEGLMIFPIVPETKRPACSGGYHGATLDPDLIRLWWGRSDYMIGLPLRPNKLIAVDSDPRNGGDVTLALAERRLGPLPREFHARSPAGGEHVIMRDLDPEGRRPRGKLDHLGLGGGVDVKCNGYVLAEPSANGAGVQYRWLTGFPTSLSVSLAPEVPEAWVDALYHPRLEDSADALGIEIWEESVDGPLGPAEVIALREKLASLGSRCNGKSTTFRAVRTIFHDWGLSLDDGWPQLCWWSEQSGKPHGQAELERRVLSVAAEPGDESYGRRGWARPTIGVAARLARAGISADLCATLNLAAEEAASELWERPAEDPGRAAVAHATEPEAIVGAAAEAHVERAMDLLEVDPGVGLPSGSAVARYLVELQRAIDDVSNHLGKAAGGDDAERPFFISAGDLFAMPDERPEWLARSLVIDGGIALVCAEPKIGKTWVATEIAVAVASGTPAFGKYATKPGRVMYFYTEDMRESVRSHVLALCAGRGMNPRAIASTLYCQPRGRAVDLSKPDDVARLVASARLVGGCKLMVLDPLRNVHEGEEDSSDSMAIVFKHIRLICDLLGCTVLVVHHAKKSSGDTRNVRPGQMARGSGAIHGFVDSGIYLRDKRGDACTITSTLESEVKPARGAGVFDLTLKLDDDEVTQVARVATWITTDAGAGEPDAEQIESWEEIAMTMVDAAYRAEVARKPLATSDQIKASVKGKTATKQCALRLAAGRGWFRQEKARGAYVLTDAGRALSRSRHALGDGEQPA